MSILIKGMKMPNTCHECRLYEGDIYYCSAADKGIDISDSSEGKCRFCPLVPVPKHGDLIDREALMMHKGNCYDADGHLLYAVGTGNILRAPTIIPADLAEEGET